MSEEKQTSYLVPKNFHGKTLSAFLKGYIKELSWSRAKKLIESGQVTVNGNKVKNIAMRLREGNKVALHETEAPQKGKAFWEKKIKIVYIDQSLVVVEKPAGLTTVRHSYEVEQYQDKSKFLPKTLAQFLPKLILEETRKRVRKGTQPPVKAVHRLDKETSGLIVFARDGSSASHLGKQFKEHTIERKYLAVVNGKVPSKRMKTHLVRDRGDGIRGSHPKNGKLAITNIKQTESFGNYSIAECTLETGRTHQIRIHLAEMGYAICGEPIYLRRFQRKKLVDNSKSRRLALHASYLKLEHPKTGKSLTFRSSFPGDLRELIKRLRKEE